VRGLETVSWPGRLEHRRLRDGRQILLDASHNPQGAEALAAYLRSTPWHGAPLVFAAMNDKDTRGMLSALLPAIGALVVTPLDPQLPMTIAADPPAALAAAWRLSARIIAAGSIFLLGDVMNEIDGA
jgi:dihydrofolate synthase / folylpolyglutamate synthase